MDINKNFQGQTMNLSHHEAMNLIDALLEWDSEIGAKELEKNEVGLNFERYSDLMQRLIDFTTTNQKTN